LLFPCRQEGNLGNDSSAVGVVWSRKLAAVPSTGTWLEPDRWITGILSDGCTETRSLPLLSGGASGRGEFLKPKKKPADTVRTRRDKIDKPCGTDEISDLL
jgi:hypothetical protein